MDIMLPVGVTIMFADNLDHSNHAGKTWVRTSVGRTPVGIDTTQTEFDSIGKQSGSKTHTLTTAQIPSHGHNYYGVGSESAGWTVDAGLANKARTGGIATSNTGGGGSHNNIQPSITVYRYRRTA